MPSLPDNIYDTVATALAEDTGTGDITADLIPVDSIANATVISREPAIFCGQAWFDEVFHQLDPLIQIGWQVTDGDTVSPDQLLCTLKGLACTLLTGERTALNFVQTLSATATRTGQFAQAIAGTGTKILDTRKTIPGLRLAQKYAVLCGGGQNHRIGLFDAILVKENHILATGSITKAVRQARTLHPGKMVEVETETLQEVEEALTAGADRLLLDNMALPALREAVALAAGRVELEASGGITLDTVRSIAETGVDFISVGELTKHIQSIDLSMRF